jgi:hypothetical protein
MAKAKNISSKITEKLVITENGVKTYEVIAPFVANINSRKIEAKIGEELELTEYEASVVQSKVKIV